MVPPCPWALIRKGTLDGSCERYYLKTCMLLKKRRGTPLKCGSYPVSSSVRFLDSRETPARGQGARWPGVHSGSATVFHETIELKTTQPAQSVHSVDETQTGEETCPEAHSWWRTLA